MGGPVLGKTLPKPRFPKNYDVDKSLLTAGKYGTADMIGIWGYDKTCEFSLRIQAQAAKTLSYLHPDVVPEEQANEIYEKAFLKYVDINRIRDIEEKKGHDVIAINTALEEVLSPHAKEHVNKAKTSADTTEPAKAIQIKKSLEIIIDSTENLRDILIEKMLDWINVPHMDNTHGYDALPTVSARPFAHYVEMLESGLNNLRYFYNNSIIGKWADATGNHHSAKSLGIDGIKLQEEYCKDLGIGFMIAPAQVPGLEFQADIMYGITRLFETINNLANYVAWGRSDDVNIFVNGSPKKQKGSSAMPHKDAKNGNPDKEEQAMSARNYLIGNLVTSMMNCEMPYARNLEASSNMRINLEHGFKFLDHNIRRMAEVMYWLNLNEERSKERVLRSFGVVTSQLVMNYLTDYRKVNNPLSRSEAHDLLGKLATDAWKNKRQFVDVLLDAPEITSRLPEDVIRDISDPLKYIGESKRIVQLVANKYYMKTTLP